MGYFTDAEFDNILDLADTIDEVVERFVNKKMRKVDATELGLDIRCGSAFISNDYPDCIVVDDYNIRTYNYYGGFEYVDDSDKKVFNGYTIFFNTSDRVQEALDCLVNEDCFGDEE